MRRFNLSIASRLPSPSYASTRTFALGGPLSIIQVANAQTLTINSAVGGAGALNKTGSGNLVPKNGRRLNH